MKKSLSIILIILVSAAVLHSQEEAPPQALGFQAIIFNDKGKPVNNSYVKLRMSILKDNAYGNLTYQETHTTLTSNTGGVNVNIGQGTPLVGDFEAIPWIEDEWYLKIEVDPKGGNNFLEMSRTQILSVPFALFAGDARNASEATHALSADYATNAGYAATAGSFSETDPFFTISPAAGISEGDKTNWDEAHSWGDHSLAGYVPNDRTISINGVANDFSDNRSWNVGTVTSVGLTLPDIFSVSGSPVNTDGTLFASFRYQTSGKVFASPSAVVGAPSFRSLVERDIPNLSWSKIVSGKPTTLYGYGITDAVDIVSNQYSIAGDKYFTGRVRVQSQINIGQSGKTINEIREITGTTHSSDYNTNISYPSGYSPLNTRVLAVEVRQNNTMWNSLGTVYHTTTDRQETIGCRLSSHSITIYVPNDAAFKGKPYRVLLMKVY